MKKSLKFLLMLFATCLSFTLTSCSDEPETPSHEQVNEIKEGSIGKNQGFQINFSGTSISIFTSSDCGEIYCERHESNIAYVGTVRKLSDITTAPTNGWSPRAKVENNGGYIITYNYMGVPYYVRLMMTTNKSATGEIVGINYSYQYFSPKNL